MTEGTGPVVRCLCGGVQVHLSSLPDTVGVCHCAMCRRWTSGPWMAVQAPGSDIRGDTLEVSFDEDLNNVRLTGPAEFVYEGVIEI